MKRGSAAWMPTAWGAPCAPDLVAVPIYAGGPKAQIDRDARPAVIACGRVFLAFGYIVRRFGGYNCRPNTSDPSVKSNHSWATAWDVNDDTNPYNRVRLITDMTRPMIRAIEAVKTVEGVQVMRSGYDWDGNPATDSPPYDAMHFEVVATRNELRMGIRADVIILPADLAKTNWIHTFPTIRQGAQGSAVSMLQADLGLTPDGLFGDDTRIAVAEYQHEHGLDEDGIVGAGTWTSLYNGKVPVIPKAA